ncbi:unnamed protein product [Brassica rapa subsp. trilocularis]
MERCLTVPTSVQNPLTMRIGVGKKDKMMLVSWCLLLVIIRLLDQGILGGEGVPPMRVCKWYPNFLTFGVSSFIRMMMKPMVLLFTGGKRKLQISPKLAYGPEVFFWYFPNHSSKDQEAVFKSWCYFV